MEFGLGEKVLDVIQPASGEVIDDVNLIFLFQKPLRQMRTNKSSPAGN